MQIIGSCFLLPFLASLSLCHYFGLCLAVLATGLVKAYLRAFYLFLLRLGLQNGRASLLLQGFHGMRLVSFFWLAQIAPILRLIWGKQG